MWALRRVPPSKNDGTKCPMAQMAEANGKVAFMQTLIDMASEKAEKMAGSE